MLIMKRVIPGHRNVVTAVVKVRIHSAFHGQKSTCPCPIHDFDKEWAPRPSGLRNYHKNVTPRSSTILILFSDNYSLNKHGFKSKMRLKCVVFKIIINQEAGSCRG
jgi:hypothetical protein